MNGMPRLNIPIALRWSDIDGYGHLNNARLLTLLEEARIAAFWSGPGVDNAASALIEGGAHAEVQSLIVRQEIEYLRPIPYVRTPLNVQLWICALGGASLDVAYEVSYTEPEGETVLAARAITTIVLVDASSGRPARMTHQQREAWGQFVDAPPKLRGRRA